MNDIALWAPALLLLLFCLVYSLSARHELYLPLPKGISDKLRNQHTVFLAMLCAFILAAAASLAEAVGGADALGLIHTAGVVFRVILFCLLALYTRALPKADRRASVLLTVVAATGVLVRAIWSAPVDLFFASVSVFGCKVMFERDTDAAENGMSDRFRLASMIAVTLVFLLGVAINVALMLNLTRAQADEIGRIQLDVIRSDLQDTLSSAEANLLHTAIRAEQLIDADAPRDSIEHFILDQRENLLADDSFMNIYIAGSDYVPGFDAPTDFHAAERVWYIGASEHPGEVFISEPYIDANTGEMCFTISTLLTDGETVVAMDLDFSKVQKSIGEMTTDKDETAMIVTDSGLIVGYTDMSLVGESATEKLPEYQTVLSRVTTSQAHDSFRVDLDGRSRIIFSSETNNHWYLILSVGTDILYAESHRQIAALSSVNLLMLLVLLVFYALNTRNRVQAGLVLEKNRRFIGGFSDRLRVLTGRILRLGDSRLLREGEAPEEFAGHIRAAGEALSLLSDDVQSYSEALFIEQEKDIQKKEKQGGSSIPTRRIRIGVVATLLVTLVVVMAFCVCISAGWGSTRLNRTTL